MESETFCGWPAFDIVSYTWRGTDLYLGLLVLERKGVSTHIWPIEGSCKRKMYH